MAKGTRPKILRAALDVFVAQGFDAATTRQIAAAVGLSEGAIYRHFPSKDSIGAELFLDIHRAMTALIDEAAALPVPFHKRVSATVTGYCRLADEDWPLFRFHLLQLHRFLHLWQDGDGDPVTSTARLIQSGMDEGAIPQGNAELLAGMALGVILQVAQNKAYGRFDGPLSDLVAAFTVAIMAVVTARG
jgi:AcrR family transcriptional regulator